jgi:transcriptional regulator with XRE-family HTH domain
VLAVLVTRYIDDTWARKTRQLDIFQTLMGWTQDKLCEAAQVSGPTLRNLEAGKMPPLHATLAVIQRILEDAGVEFTNGDEPGVKLRKTR